MEFESNQKVLPNPELPCPPEILKQQVVIGVEHIDFAGRLRSGVIEINRLVADDVAAFFKQALRLNFPVEKVARASDSPCAWNDDALMEANVSSGFNYRAVAGTNKLSLHSRGLAFDVNPRQNPYVRYESQRTITAPVGAVWRPDQPGTLSAEHPLVKFMLKRGWEWGGNWSAESGRIDYQHLQKDI